MLPSDTTADENGAHEQIEVEPCTADKVAQDQRK